MLSNQSQNRFQPSRADERQKVDLQTDLQTPGRKQERTGGHECGSAVSEFLLLPRTTRHENTVGNGVRRTFNPKVEGSIPSGPTSEELSQHQGTLSSPRVVHRERYLDVRSCPSAMAPVNIC
jgi:hypothetical protein